MLTKNRQTVTKMTLEVCVYSALSMQPPKMHDKIRTIISNKLSSCTGHCIIWMRLWAYFLTFRPTCIESLRSKWHINSSTIHSIHSYFAAISLSTKKTLIQIDSRLKCEARVQKFSEFKYLPFRVWRVEERNAHPATATKCKHKIANRQQSLTSISANIVNVHTI